MIGLEFKETMTGVWKRPDDGAVALPLSFTITGRGRGIWPTFFEADGTIDAPSLATHRPIRGKLIASYIILRIIRYELQFEGDDGRLYMFNGQKDIRFSDLIASSTTLPFTILHETGALVGEGVAKFLGKEVWRFIRSIRTITDW